MRFRLWQFCHLDERADRGTEAALLVQADNLPIQHGLSSTRQRLPLQSSVKELKGFPLREMSSSSSALDYSECAEAVIFEFEYPLGVAKGQRSA